MMYQDHECFSVQTSAGTVPASNQITIDTRNTSRLQCTCTSNLSPSSSYPIFNSTSHSTSSSHHHTCFPLHHCQPHLEPHLILYVPDTLESQSNMGHSTNIIMGPPPLPSRMRNVSLSNNNDNNNLTLNTLASSTETTTHTNLPGSSAPSLQRRNTHAASSSLSGRLSASQKRPALPPRASVETSTPATAGTGSSSTPASAGAFQTFPNTTSNTSSTSAFTQSDVDGHYSMRTRTRTTSSVSSTSTVTPASCNFSPNVPFDAGTITTTTTTITTLVTGTTTTATTSTKTKRISPTFSAMKDYISSKFGKEKRRTAAEELDMDFACPGDSESNLWSLEAFLKGEGGR